MQIFSSFAECDAEKANREAENAGRGRTQSSYISQAESETRTGQEKTEAKHARGGRAYKSSPSRRAFVLEPTAVASSSSQESESKGPSTDAISSRSGRQRTPKGARDTERTLGSRSGARAEPERSRGPRKDHETPKGRSGAGAEPERNPNGAEDPERTTGLRKDARAPETILFRDCRISRHF